MSQAYTLMSRSRHGKRCAHSFFCSTVVLNRPHELRQVTDAVHAKGSYIFLQLWALGRAADIDVLEKQDPPSPYVSASSVALTGKPKLPRPLTEVEIQDYITAYVKAAGNAVHGAGFDGVEIHAANGYLLDQFLQTVSNNRTDRWGGDEEGRTRFAREVVHAVAEAVGEDRVGLRISPWSTFQGETIPVDLNLMCSRAHLHLLSRHGHARSTTNICIPNHRSTRQASQDGIPPCGRASRGRGCGRSSSRRREQ